jgi:hypothetical protein
MAQKKNLLPEQIYGDQSKFVNNMGFSFLEHEYPNVQPIYGCPTTPYMTREQPIPQDKKLRKIKDILTVTEFEKLDIVRIIGFNKEALNEYIQLLIKVRDSGAYEEPEEVPERPSLAGITTDTIDEIFKGATNKIFAEGSVNTKRTLSSVSHPDQPSVMNADHPVSLTSEGDKK